MEEKVKSFGKVRYVEPNDFLEDKIYDKDGEYKSFNTTHPYEDYSISVDLTVKVPNRIGSATNENRTHTITLANQTIDGDDFSFFSGTNNNLTDAPGTTTYLDILNGDTSGINESLGITSIAISYNSYFYPEVTINFSDIRGTALMMPHEENYRREQINIEAQNAGINKVYDTKVENFFASLFSFPYPEFILRVKGFYGKKVEYSLVVSDFRSSFNNQTGNFDATVKFIGKMYGVYTDIPMSYLIISPYCKYGSDNNKTIWEEKGFKIDENTPMPTFIELKRRALEASSELKSVMSISSVQRYSKLKNKQALLISIEECLNILINFIQSNFGNNIIIGDYNILFNKSDGRKYCDYLYNENGNNISYYIKQLYNLISKYNEEETGDKLPYLTPLSNSDVKIGEDNVNFFNFSKKNGEIYYSKGNDFMTKYSLLKSHLFDREDKSLENNIKNYFKNKDNNNRFYYISFFKLKNSLKEIKEKVNRELIDINSGVGSDIDDNIISIIGFVPSIKNIFKMLMAHLQCFVELYARFVSNVTGTNARDLTKHNLSFNNAVDIPNISNSSDNTITIPPFPAIKNDKNNTYCYPSADIIDGKMEETNFIDALFSGNLNFNEELSAVLTLQEDLANDSIELIPTCLTDYLTLFNPYEYTFTNNKGTIDIDWIMTFFGIRCISKMLLEQTDYLGDEEFGKCEAYNFWCKNKDLNKNIIDKLTSIYFNEDVFYRFLSGDVRSHYILNGNACYKKNNKTKSLLKFDSSDNKLRLNNEFNFPSVVCRNNRGIKTFWEDTEDKTGIYSIQSGNTKNIRPYNYVKFISDENIISELNDKIKSFDMSPYCTPDQANQLVDVYTNNTKGLFNDGYVTYRKNNFNIENNYVIKYNKKNTPYKTHGLKYLSEYYDNNYDSNLTIDSIGNEIPVFFIEDLTAEKFLMNIPYDNEKLAYFLKEGKRIITMPYATQLFIGMIIHYLNSSDINTFNNLIDEINKINSNSLKGLIYVIFYLTRSEEGEFYEDVITDNNFKDNNDVDNLKLLKRKYSDYCKIDFLGLSNKFIDWKNGNYPGSFNYFKDKYELTDSTDVWNINGNNIFGDNTYERLCNLTNNFTNLTSVPFDEIFTSPKGENNSKNAFSSRYSYVHSLDKKNGEKLILSFNIKFEAYEKLNEFFQKKNSLVLPYQMKPYNFDSYYAYTPNGIVYNTIKNSIPEIDVSKFKKAFKGFKKQLLSLYNISDENRTVANYKNFENQLITEESKLSMYLTLKNLYDKHFTDIVNKKSLYDINTKDGEFSRFHFIDTFYNDIGDDLKFNIQTIIDVIDSLTNTENNELKPDMSVYSFMSLLCEKHNMMLLSMPVFNGSFTNDEGVKNLEAMFTPTPFLKSVNENTLTGPSYICFYPHQASHHLDIPNGQYSNDGFLITGDINDTGNFEGPISINDLQIDGKNNYIIPAFGIEYGSQKQSIFKNININMDNPQTTEIAVANQFNLVNDKSTEVRKLGFEGQDLFKIYSNYSYTCQAEMMGCAQIQPLMYFQLNNIPMFRGAYQIINVEHNITPGDMRTSFKGVRINKTKIPMVSHCISLSRLDDIINNNSSYDKEKSIAKSTTIDNAIIGDAENNGMDIILNEDGLIYDYDKIKKDMGNFFKFASDTNEASAEYRFNKLNPGLQKLTYGIVNRAKSEGYGVIVTSSIRGNDPNSESASDHVTGSSKCSSRRKDLGYKDLGCALDLQGTNKQGIQDKVNGSVPLFHLIATEFTDNIRQLIWEVKEHNPSSQDCISNCIHLASYGDKTKNDKTDIFVASGPKWGSIEANNSNNPSKLPTNLPPMFIKTLYDLSLSSKYNNVNLLNFKKQKPTKEDLEKWCRELNI